MPVELVPQAAMIAELTIRIIDDLQADYERPSGRLTRDDVHRILLARLLGAPDAVDVWQAVLRARIGIDQTGPIKQFLA